MTSNNKKDRFDLEQQILDTWRIIDDLKLMCLSWDKMENEHRLNILASIAALYDIRFDNLFTTLEECVNTRQFKE
jgi:hypothetical protein